MRIALCLVSLVSAVLTANIKINPLSDEIINRINSRQNSWIADRNFYKNMSTSEIKKLFRDPNSKITPTVHSKDIEIPATFDAREHWPECSKVIGTIVDQSACNSGWAVAATSAMSDRRCIVSGGSLQVPVSAEDLRTCCGALCGIHSYGCQMGDEYKAWKYWAETGIVTGGPYNSSLGCKPYNFQPCDHDVNGTHVQCDTLSVNREAICLKSCNTSGLDYNSERTFGENKGDLFWTIEDAQRDILKNGPVTALFIYDEDFIRYKSGVYHYVGGPGGGGGTVAKIIGWGTENDEDYWLAANSWNEDWGDAGLFKIRRGTNEGLFEDGITSARPKL